jgi:Zn-dependent M28 family amino/carboxypeptidase
MIKRSMALFFALFVAFTGFGQNAEALKYGSMITQASLRKHLEIVAADDMEGRDTGTPGQWKAAEYIAAEFEKLGLVKPVNDGGKMSYLQKFDLERTGYGEVSFRVGSKSYAVPDVVFFGNTIKSKAGSGNIVFVGKGEASDIQGLNLKGATALLYSPGPGYEAKVDAIKKAGAEAVMVVNTENDEQFRNVSQRFRNFATARRLGLPNPNAVDNLLWIISPSQAAGIIGRSEADLVAMANSASHKSLKPVKYSYKIERVIEKVPTANVLGVVEGTDLKSEVVVLSAHYDHVGMTPDGQINNGADDDGSGTVAVMEMARAFAEAAKNGIPPRRTMVFLLVTGEERGLLGSRYYTDFDPIFPLENTVTNINIDMIGRLDTEHENNGIRDYIYPIGSAFLSTELKMIIDYTNVTYTNLKLDYRFDDPEDTNRFYFRSDHYNFAKHGIPVVFMFNGVHADYHKPTDTIDKIEWDVFEKRTHLIFFTAWDLAHRNRKPIVDMEMDERLTSR